MKNMSEYNKFLKMFNKAHSENEDASLSEREDIIPVRNAAPEAQQEEKTAEEKPAETESPEEKTKETVSPAIIPASDDTATDSIPKGRFIKKNDAEFISVKGNSDKDVPTAATKYTDRLLPGIPEKKPVLEDEPKTGTYSDNHAPRDNERKIIPVGDEEKAAARRAASEKATPAATAQSQTKIIPSLVKTEEDEDLEPKVILEKIPEGAVSDETKPLQEKGRLLREIAKTSDGNLPDDDQLTMEGFTEENNDNIPDITSSDEALSEELSKVREKRINSFRFWTKAAAETGESEDKSFSPSREELQLPAFLLKIREKFGHLDTDFTPVGEEEYQDPSRRKEIFSRLIEARKNTIIKAFIAGIIGIIVLIINLAASISAEMNNGFFSLFGGSAVAYNIINLVCLLASGVIVKDELKKGIFSILKIRPKTDSALLIMYLGALAQNIASFFTQLKTESEYHLLTGAVIILAASVLAAKSFYLDSTRHCFKAVGTTSDKCYLRKISDEALISQLLREKNTTETNVVYTGKTRFISNFLKRSASAAFAGQVSSRVVVLSAVAALVSGIIGFIITKSPVYAFGCFTLTSALSFPVSCLIFTGYALSAENNALSVKSSFVGSYNDAYSFYCIDDIILRGEDIFSAEVVSSACNKNVSPAQAEFCAAVISDKAGGILGKAFSVYSGGLEDKYPEVEGLSIEDKLGLSAWISDCRVLLGTKQLLINHNVELPEENTVPFMLEENTRPLFLAIEGHFAAVFSVKYSCHAGAAKSLRSLASNGANILVSILDPNITEEFGETVLGLPAESLRIMKKDANEDFIKNKNTVTDSEDTGIVFSDSFEAFSRTIEGAVKLEKFRRISKALCQAVSLAGMLLGILLTATSALSLMCGWPVVFLQVCMMLLSFLVTPRMAASAVKKKIVLPEKLAGQLRINTSSDDKELFDMYGEKKETEEEAEASDESKEGSEETSEDTAEDEADDTLSDDGIFGDEEAEKVRKKRTAGRIRKILNAVTEKAEESTAEDTEGEQMIMQGAPYTEPPEVIDFSKIKPQEEEAQEDKPVTITDDILDLFAEDGSTKPAAKRTAKKKSFFDKLSGSEDGEPEEAPPEKAKKPARFSLFANEEKMAPPPRYDLSKKEEEKEDPLKATFIPPETDGASTLYKDDFFSSFDTEEDDKTFADIRRQREEAQNGGADEFDFWTIKKE